MWGPQLQLSSIKSTHRRGCQELVRFLKRTPPPPHAHIIYRVNFVLWPQGEPTLSPDPDSPPVPWLCQAGTRLLWGRARLGWPAFTRKPRVGLSLALWSRRGTHSSNKKWRRTCICPLGLGESRRRHTVGTQEESALSIVGGLTAAGESCWKDPRRPWRKGGWEDWGGPGWPLKAVDAAAEWRL